MKPDNNLLDWSDLAFTSKSLVNKLNPYFILAPREISNERFTSLLREYLPKGNILIGISKEGYVAGFEGQPQFRMLKLDTIQKTIDKVNFSNSKHRVVAIRYFQREVEYLIDKLKIREALLINGSWKYAFHNNQTFYTLTKKGIPFSYLSPFDSESEALTYEKSVYVQTLKNFNEYLDKNHQTSYTDTQMMAIAEQSSRFSYDYNFQTGAALGKLVSTKEPRKYKYLLNSFNKVVPFQTYALLNGASRETNFSPPHDLNHYDTVHAELEALVIAQKNKLDLKSTTMFVNLLPCPTCSRLICETDISEIVYNFDHSDGYAIKMLEKAGKKVRRLVT